MNLLAQQVDALSTGETNHITILANASALLNDALDDINWIGFYLLNEETNELELGPFQGKVACTRIEVGRGVCGTAVAQKSTVLVDNVHEFAGHIACDSASNSEIVIPLQKNNKILGVLDIDSPTLARFTNDDKDILEEFVKALVNHL